MSADPATLIHGKLVELRLLTGDVPAGLRTELRRIHAEPAVAHWWDPPGPEFPEADDPDSVQYVITTADTTRGLVQYAEEHEPKYRHAAIDIFLDPAVHGRGYGLDAVLTVALHLIQDRGHRRISIDPAAANTAAIACYTAAGFRPVGLLRDYERDADGAGWHDGLLMDALAPEVLAAAAGRGASATVG